MSVPTPAPVVPPAPTPPAPTPPAPPPGVPADLGDAGQRALVAERQRVAQLEGELAQRNQRDEAARVAALSEQEQKIEQAKKEVTDSLTKDFNGKLQTAKVAARAAATFHDGEMAAAMITTLPENATEAQIDAALEALGKEKAFLLKSSTTPPIPGGPRGGPNGETITGAPSDTDGEKWLRDTVAQRRGTPA